MYEEILFSNCKRKGKLHKDDRHDICVLAIAIESIAVSATVSISSLCERVKQDKSVS